MNNDESCSSPSPSPSAQPIGALDESIRRFIRAITEGERIDIEKWLSTLDKFYDEWNYSSSQRITYTVSILNEEQKTWYKQRPDPHYAINDRVLIRRHGMKNKLEPKFSITPQIIIREEHPVYVVKDEVTESETRVHINDIRPIYVSKLN